MVSKKLIANAEHVADFLAVLANPWRLLIMCHLANDGEMSVGALGEKLMISQSSLSQHLSKLRALDLVATRRESQTIYYSCKSDAVRELLSVLEGMYGEGIPEMKLHLSKVG
jgi:DNA-binding transcriptional ArsR family regulator